MKVKNDHRSKFSNLSNWKEEAWKKKSALQRGGHGFESRWSPDFFQASSFQLLKLENLLRWSFFTFTILFGGNSYGQPKYFGGKSHFPRECDMKSLPNALGDRIRVNTVLKYLKLCKDEKTRNNCSIAKYIRGCSYLPKIFGRCVHSYCMSSNLLTGPIRVA